MKQKMAEAMVGAETAIPAQVTQEESPMVNVVAQFDALKSSFTGMTPEQKMTFKEQVSDLMEFVNEMA